MEYKPVSSLLYADCASGPPGHMAHPEIMCSVSSVPIVHAAVPKRSLYEPSLTAIIMAERPNCNALAKSLPSFLRTKE